MKKNNKKGFTLVELVIVVAVMAILVAVAIPTVSSITGKAKTSVRESNARAIESILKLEEAELATADGATAGADGSITITLTGPQINKALTDAKLGIKSDSFYYVPTTGQVSTAATSATGEITITFDANGVVTAPAAS